MQQPALEFFDIDLYPVESLAIKPPENMTISEWSEKKRVLSDQSEEKGPLRLRRTPYFKPVLDKAQEDHVEAVVLCKSAQVAGTETAISIIGYYADQEPCPIMFVLADEDTAVYMSKERLQKTFKTSPQLEHLCNNARFGKTEITLANGSYIAMAWASSVAKLASRPMRILVLDEVDKPGYYVSSKEAGPISLAIERTETFFRRKIFILSTPTIETGNITKALENCDVVYDWHVPCPYCGQYQPLRWSREYQTGFAKGMYRDGKGEKKRVGQVVWEGGRAASEEQIMAAGYECGECEEVWTTGQKNLAVEKGKMVARSEVPERATRIGYHINRIYSLLGNSGNIPKMVRDYIGSLDDPKLLQGFVNSTLAEPWKMVVTRKSEDMVLEARADLDPQVVPEKAIALTCGIDPQKSGFYFVVRAWARDFTSWLIHYGFLSAWEDVDNLLFGTAYPIGTSKKAMRIYRAAIDTGGTKFDNDPSMTEQAYYWIRKNGIGRGCRVWATKGSARPLAGKVHLGKNLDRTPSGAPLPGGLQLIMLDPSQLKDMYHYRLQCALEHDPEAAYLHSETGLDYARQILAEEKQINEKGLQVWVQIRKDNHYLDCFDKKTEILTRDRWISCAKVNKNDEIATVNLDSDSIEYQHPTHLIKKFHKGEMIKIKGRRIDVLATPNHRMVVYKKKFDGRKNKRKHYYSGPEISLAKDLTVWDKLKITSNWNGKKHSVFYFPATKRMKMAAINPADWAEFLGWYVSEGHRHKMANGAYRVVISQNNKKNQEKIKRLLNRLPWNWHITGGRQFILSNKQVYSALDDIGDGAENKSIPYYLKQASVDLIEIFLNAAILGDGWVQNGFRTYSTISRQLADDIQEMFIKTGNGANIKIVDPPNCIIRGENLETKIQYHISECKTKNISLRDSQNRPLFKKTNFSDYVYCVSVPNGTLICRRNGKSFIAGNCEAMCHATAHYEWPEGGINVVAHNLAVEQKKREDMVRHKKKMAGKTDSRGYKRPNWLNR